MILIPISIQSSSSSSLRSVQALSGYATPSHILSVVGIVVLSVILIILIRDMMRL